MGFRLRWGEGSLVTGLVRSKRGRGRPWTLGPAKTLQARPPCREDGWRSSSIRSSNEGSSPRVPSLCPDPLFYWLQPPCSGLQGHLQVTRLSSRRSVSRAPSCDPDDQGHSVPKRFREQMIITVVMVLCLLGLHEVGSIRT